jgi:hypothetical protein
VEAVTQSFALHAAIHERTILEIAKGFGEPGNG